MEFVRSGSAWFYAVIFAFFQCWAGNGDSPLPTTRSLSASTSPVPLPTPTLGIHSRSKDSVVLVCRAPESHRGLLFMLYHDRQKVDSLDLQTAATEARFTVSMKGWLSGQDYFFCCLYKNPVGQYSAFSPYLKLERRQAGDGPLRSNPSFITPHLSVDPPADSLPAPTLTLQQQTDVWHLQCTGSPAYPGASFSLFLEDNEFPVATARVKAIQHQATFPVPVQEAPLASYQCQYSVLLGRTWSNSQRSASLAVTRGIVPAASPGVDWPLVLGSFSAAVLFLGSLALLVVLVKRKVKAVAEEKKRREEAQFWTQVHGKDHVVDLTLRRSNFTSQEWASGDTETASRLSTWNPLSTFTAPVHPVY